MTGPCADLRVLDLSRGTAGHLATMILADYGAEVIRVERPGDDPTTTEPAYPLLNRGKRSIGLDLHAGTGPAAVRRLAPGLDVIVEDMTPGGADALGLGYGDLSALNPALVYCSITAFGRTGPFAAAPADDALVMAKAGILRDQPGWEQDGTRPIYRSCPDATYFAGMLAVQGIVTALRARDLTGRGQRVDTNLLQALTCRQNPQVRWLRREGEALPADRSTSTTTVPDAINPLAHHRDPREVSIIGMLVECKDGRWLIHSLSEPHFFPAWIEAIDFQWIWDDPRFAGAPHRFPDSDTKAELVMRLKQRMKELTADEWMERYLANGNVCADVIQTTQEALRHPQVAAGHNTIVIDDPDLGPTLQIGPLAKLPGCPPATPAPAPRPRADTEAVLGAEVTPVRLPTPSRPTLAGPLDGITIVEAAYYYATPFATALLAELGARVIKIEPIKGDPYRLLGSGGGDPVGAIGHNNMVRSMQGKESIALNLKDERGREILHRIVAGADAFVHSFRKGVPESLGIDQATLSRVNPNLVYHYGASYGSVGPSSAQPAIDPVIAAFAGTTAYQAGEGNPPLRESGADPAAAAGHAAALALALYARHRSGTAQYVESAMIVSNIYLNYDDALSYEGKAPRPTLDARQLGTAATHRLYQTAPAESAAVSPHGNPDARWVMLAADGDESFARFCAVAGRDDLGADHRYASTAARERNRAELEAALEAVFLTRSAASWEADLLAAGVGCVQADLLSHYAFLYEDTQAQALDMMTKVDHPSLGPYWRYSPVIQFSDTPSKALPVCDLGEHTDALLRELDYSDAEISELRADGVVT